MIIVDHKKIISGSRFYFLHDAILMLSITELSLYRGHEELDQFWTDGSFMDINGYIKLCTQHFLSSCGSSKTDIGLHILASRKFIIWSYKK